MPSPTSLHELVVGHSAGRTNVLLLAHQGGWDEILMVLVPVSLFAVLLYVANQRATRLASREGATVGDAAADDGTPPGSAEAAADDTARPVRPRAVPKNDRRGPV